VTLTSSLLPQALSTTDTGIRDGIHTTATNLLILLSRGWDYFGNAENYVPLGSPKVYLEQFKEAVGLLEKREQTYLAYRQNLDDKKSVSGQRTAAVTAAKADIENKEQYIDDLKADLRDYVDVKIRNADDKIKGSQQALIHALKDLGSWVETCFGLTPQDAAECLFNLAFVNSEFTAFTTLVSESIKLADKAQNTIPNDDGQAVSRKHMLLRVDRFSKRLSKLDEAWETIQSVTKSGDPELVALQDPDAYRLLVEQNDFNNLLQQFYTKDTAREAMSAMDAYVEEVQRRNATLVEYNIRVTEYLRAAGEYRATVAQKNQIETLQSDAADPNFHAEAAFASALYNRMRETCIRIAYDACRAYRFWSLKPDRALYETFKLGSPGAINHLFLSGVLQNLEFEKLNNQVTEGREKKVGRTPPEKVDYEGTGVCVMLGQERYPHEFERLRKDGVARFSVPFPRIGFERFRLQLQPLLLNRDLGSIAVSQLSELLRRARILLILSKSGAPNDNTIYLNSNKNYRTQIVVHVTQRKDSRELLVIKILDGDKLHYTFREDGGAAAQKAERIKALKDRHQSLFLQPRALPQGIEDQIIDDVASIVGKGAGKEGVGKDEPRPKGLVVLSWTGGNLFDPWQSFHFEIRVFDDEGKLLAETSEAEHRDRIGKRIDAFKERIRPLLDRPSLAWTEERQIIQDIASILDKDSIWRPMKKSNPFDGHAEVRVTKVRAWVFSVQTKPDTRCHVELKHLGNEIIRRNDGAIVELTHPEVEGIQFDYDWSKVLWNFREGYVENPHLSLLHHGTDGEIYPQGESDYPPLIGPFAQWEIRIEEGKHNGLDRSKISSICLDFHILSKAISTGPLPPAT
jgi:hypothetical protein